MKWNWNNALLDNIFSHLLFYLQNKKKENIIKKPVHQMSSRRVKVHSYTWIELIEENKTSPYLHSIEFVCVDFILILHSNAWRYFILWWLLLKTYYNSITARPIKISNLCILCAVISNGCYICYKTKRIKFYILHFCNKTFILKNKL